MIKKIVVDSCCDLTEALMEKLNAIIVPLTMSIGNTEYVDDKSLNLDTFMDHMNSSSEVARSAAPSPGLYQEAFESTGAEFAVTLSANLSGSYASAVAGKDLAESSAYVFDSKSASTGEVLTAIKISELLHLDEAKDKIIETVEDFISKMKTYFVLENLDNLVKNGRLNKIAGKIASALNIRPILGADANGNIAFFSYVRGAKNIIKKMADTIEKSGKDTNGEIMIISHCKNPEMAEQLKDEIQNRFSFKDILIVPTKGLSSMYANEKGLIMSF